MKKTIYKLMGSVRVKMNARYPERVLNLLAREGIEFWDTDIEGEALSVTLHTGGYKRLIDLAEEKGLEVLAEKTTGVPHLLGNIKARWALFFSLVLCVCLVFISSFYIWQIEVIGNETVPSERILAELKRLGVGIGTNRLTISQDSISNEMLMRITELSWITVNTKGSRAQVIVREEKEAPEIIDESVPTEVRAEKTGIITEMTVLEGAPQVAVGDTVMTGELLVSGKVGSIASGDRFVHARAEIWARTWYKFSASMPLDTVEKEYTGEKTHHFALAIGENRINLYFLYGNKYSEYDKITEYKKIMLPGGAVLPVQFICETSREYVSKTVSVAEQEAETILKARLLQKLSGAVAEGSVTETAFESSVENGVLTVRLTAECLERIDSISNISNVREITLDD